MIIVVEGTKSFSDYEIFMRAMSVALSHPSMDSDIQVWSVGPHKINNFTASFGVVSKVAFSFFASRSRVYIS